MTGIILAAGKSKRINAKIPKVLLPLRGKPLLSYVLATARDAGLPRIIIVVGRSHIKVKKAFAQAKVEFVLQPKRLGTADAVKTCKNLLTANEEIVVFCGDVPLLRAQTVKRMMALHRKEKADATLLTAILANPTGYGRIVRDENNQIKAIVEERDATAEIKKIQEINVGTYIFRWQRLAPILEKLKPSPVTGEYYLTDAVAALNTEKAKVVAYTTLDTSEALGVNTPQELNLIEEILGSKSEAS